ncbi:F0F1 ATP synthase subunit B [Rhizosaccharibacter radicis]|uniref:ATP synthase subunit b n=1 Tax=Rhizosaccharibacter radicis TaxID=2782605 RepID=A0ABT1VYX7_9PROT|nr:F0F1 ATP synthase subunit B [Acetobacteraceae bacterium KSS12]
MLHEPLFWYTVAFVLFFVLVGRRIWRPLAAMLDARAAAVRLELDEAARLKREAEAMLAEAQRERDAAMADSERMVANARAEAARIAEAAAREADANAARRERMAQDRIGAAQRAAVTEVRDTAATVATEVARRIVTEALDADADAVLVDRAIARLPAVLTRGAA